MVASQKEVPVPVIGKASHIDTPVQQGTSETDTHCPYRQASLLQQALVPDKMRVGFFLGAGCPVSIRVENGGTTKPLIPDISGLTQQVLIKLKESAELSPSLTSVLKRLGDSGIASPDVEIILSHIRSLQEVVGTGNIDGLSAKNLADLDKKICEETTSIVQARLSSDHTPYHHLATWISGVHRAHPVEVFTSNYDLLVEQALEQRKVPYFDGFVGSDRTFFDLPSMEQDALPARWARLWKVHGSINWWRTTEGNVERKAAPTTSEERQMIYPSHIKYDQSRRMPYLAMLDRLKSFLSRGQSVLVTCGYSFADQHLNDVIIQGLSGNPNAVCFGLLFGDRSNYPEAVRKARKQANLRLLAVDGAVLNTIERDWHAIEKGEHPLNIVAVKNGAMGMRSKAPADLCKFLLGDFMDLGNFLAKQLDYRHDDLESRDGK